MRVDWDDAKSEKLKSERGLSLVEAADVFKGLNCCARKNDCPEQYAVIGFSNGQLITLIVEYREDDLGEFIWLITYWKATKTEAKFYEEFWKRKK